MYFPLVSFFFYLINFQKYIVINLLNINNIKLKNQSINKSINIFITNFPFKFHAYIFIDLKVIRLDQKRKRKQKKKKSGCDLTF